MKRWFVGAIACAVLALVSLGLYARLPVRALDVRRADLAEVDRAPRDGVFRIGDITWDTAAYAREPRLAPLRELFAAHCAGRLGLDAAVCVSDVFAAKFPHGGPREDAFTPDYDPVRDLQSHLAGEPGHCVTRSSLVSLVLLANGIPARFVQFLHPKYGHNMMEVWDATNGWVLLDPTFGRVFADARGPRSAVGALLRAEGSPVPRGAAVVPVSDGFYSDLRGPAVELSYPEPWVYARGGARLDAWPFRAVAETAGASYWRYGPAQRLLRGAFACLVVLGAAFAALGARARLRRRAKVALGLVAADDDHASVASTARAA